MVTVDNAIVNNAPTEYPITAVQPKPSGAIVIYVLQTAVIKIAGINVI